MNEVSNFLLNIQNNIVSNNAYKNSFLRFFKQLNIKKEDCLFFYARVSILEGSSVYSICSKDNKKILVKLKEKVINHYINAVNKSDINNLIPLNFHEDYKIQLCIDRKVYDYYLLFNVNGVVFNVESVFISLFSSKKLVK